MLVCGDSGLSLDGLEAEAEQSQPFLQIPHLPRPSLQCLQYLQFLQALHGVSPTQVALDALRWSGNESIAATRRITSSISRFIDTRCVLFGILCLARRDISRRKYENNSVGETWFTSVEQAILRARLFRLEAFVASATDTHALTVLPLAVDSKGSNLCLQSLWASLAAASDAAAQVREVQDCGLESKRSI